MTFRDDKEAAFERAQALQRELETKDEQLADQQDELSRTKAKLEAAEAERARLAAEVERTRPKPPPSVAASTSNKGIGIAVGLCVLLGVIVMIVASGRQSQDPPNPTCTLRTQPPGATVSQRCRDEVLGQVGSPGSVSREFRMHRGTTPLSNPRFDWIAEGVTCKGPYVIELAGYVTVETSSPTEGLGCTDRIIELQPK